MSAHTAKLHGHDLAYVDSGTGPASPERLAWVACFSPASTSRRSTEAPTTEDGATTIARLAEGVASCALTTRSTPLLDLPRSSDSASAALDVTSKGGARLSVAPTTTSCGYQRAE